MKLPVGFSAAFSFSVSPRIIQPRLRKGGASLAMIFSKADISIYNEEGKTLRASGWISALSAFPARGRSAAPGGTRDFDVITRLGNGLPNESA